MELKMKINIKRTLLVTLIAGLTSSAYAAEIKTSTLGIDPSLAAEKTGIQGWRPYMAAIGSQVVFGGQQEGDKIIPTVGTVIEIPTYATGSELFKYVDKDGDISAGLGMGITLADKQLAKTEFSVEWYIIEPKSGNWDAVGSWADLNAELIDTAAIGAGNNSLNQNSKTVVVPENAAGKRIGFIATPTSEYGSPKIGQPIKAWDLSKIWTQTEPTEPGECDPSVTDCEDNGNGNGGDNNNGGGGTVIATDYQINVYDAKTNTPVLPTTKLRVGQEFFATIRIKQVDGEGKETYRDPTTDELDSLKWNMVNANGEIIAYYDKDSDRLNVDDEKFSYAGQELTKYTFATQTTNEDAAEELKSVTPFSEQSYGLQVVLTIADK